MSQSSVKNMKVAPLRMSELLPEILAMKQMQDYETEAGYSSSPDRSYSDSDIMDHNRGFYNNYNSNYKPDITYPGNKMAKEAVSSDSQYSQTYPNESQCSATKGRHGRSGAATPVQTPRKCRNTSSVKSHKLKTPRSSAKKKTPHMFKTSAKKSTPFRKCLNLEDAFKSTTKSSLFSATKPPPPPAHNLTGHTLNESSNFLVPAQSPALDEVFASALHISDEKMTAPPPEKTNPFASKFNIAKPLDVFATPKSNISSNMILKGCRENNFATPHRTLDISGVHKYETPSTQNRIIPHKNQNTPLLPIKEKITPSQQASVKKTCLSIRKDKENIHIKTGMQKMQRKGLFSSNEYDINSANNKLSALKESQFGEPDQKKKDIFLKDLSANNILLEHAHSNHDKKVTNDNLPRYLASNNHSTSNQTPQIEGIVKSTQPINQKERYTNEVVKDSTLELLKPPSIFPPKHNREVLPHPAQNHLPNSIDKENDLDRLLVNKNIEPKPTPQRVSISDNNLRPPKNQFRMLTMKGKQYTVLGKIGAGGSSEVFKVMDPTNSSMFAVKCVNLAVDQPVAQGYVNEIKMLQRLQGSDRVITMYDYEYVEKQKMLYVLLEMGDVDLSSLMKGYRARESHLPLPLLVFYWTEMLSAVNHTHKHGIIHSDLKPANFLLAHGRLKLIDFGIASSVSADATSVYKDATAGTFNYISPEAVSVGTGGREPVKISYKSDVWSLGCILYSMLYGRTPFSHMTHILALVAALSNPNQPISYPELKGIPPVLMRALRWCLNRDPKQRPTVQQLMELPYIRGSTHPRLPLPLLAKVRAALTDDEWRTLAQHLDDN